MKPLDYWTSGAGLAHITPPRAPTPEPEGFAAVIRDWVSGRTLLDFGCGIGRLAHLFDPNLYCGVDVCAEALAQARAVRPEYRFELVDDEQPLPAVDVVFANSVLMHVPDDRLSATVRRFGRAAVIVSEILGRHWRGRGDPPVFNRSAEDYAAVLAPRRATRSIALLCAHYRETDLTVMEFA